MKRIIIITKYSGYTLLWLTMVILLYLATEWCLSGITINKEPGESQDVAIYIKTNGLHTDIVVPVKNELFDWSKEVKYSNTLSADTAMKFLGIGWGDKGFYLETPEWSDLKFSVAFNAAFALSTTAIHATYFKSMKENESCRKIFISKVQYLRLINFILNSFQKDLNGHFINIKTNANYGNTDAFYEAKGRYSILRTCNSWANSALKSCGQKACLWTAFDTGIFIKYRP